MNNWATNNVTKTKKNKLARKMTVSISKDILNSG